MKKRAVSMILAAAMVCGMMTANVSCVSAKGSDEGKVINIYSWNDEFRQRLEAVYPEVESTSKDGTVTKLKDGTEIHWIVNPNQDGVYQQKLDEALLNQADASADDKVDIFLSETDYVFKYTDKDADVAMPLTDLGIDPDKDLADQYDFTKTQLLMRMEYREAPHGSAARVSLYIVVTLRKMFSVLMTRKKLARR